MASPPSGAASDALLHSHSLDSRSRDSRSLAMLLGSAGIAAGALLWHGLATHIAVDPAWSSTATRLGVASLSLLPAAGVLWLIIMAQMLGRFVSGRIDPTQGQDGAFLRVNQRALTNGVEQSICFMPALLALAAGVTAGEMPRVIALALVFAAARALFWLGYLARPLLRTPGMAASFTTVTATIAAAAWVWLA